MNGRGDCGQRRIVFRGSRDEDNMCLAVPALVKSVDGYEAEVELSGVTRRASLMLTPEAKVGDYVLLHAGYAINVVDQSEAEETLSMLREMARLGEASE